jgi:uncharacterized membrane protein
MRWPRRGVAAILDPVSRGRLEAFSDGVIAILVTIMVLNLRPPSGDRFTDLRSMVPQLLVYVLSFVMLAIYWNNHHHLMQVVERIDGRVLWANMALLFSLSLMPIATAWLGAHWRASGPVLAYGLVLLAAAIAYFILTTQLLRIHAADSRLAVAIGQDWKGKLSAAGYVVAVLLALVVPPLSIAIYIAIAVVWLVPDRRIERVAADPPTPPR